MKKRTWYLLEGTAVIIVLVILSALMIPEFIESQNNINTPKRIPDPNFRAFIEELMGVKPGEAITKDQASAMTEIMQCSGKEIQSLKGIEYFHNIQGLDCKNNQLTELTLPKNDNMMILMCSSNQLTSLDLFSLSKLLLVHCDHNQISQINVSNNTMLENVLINNNEMDDLIPFTELKRLKFLQISNNHLSADDHDDVIYFHQNQRIKFEFEKHKGGTFQTEPIEGVVGFLTSNP